MKKKDLDEIKALAAPMKVIVDICAVCLYLSPKNSSNTEWAVIKSSLLSDTKLIEGLQKYDVEKTNHKDAKKAQELMERIEKDMRKEVKEKEGRELERDKISDYIFNKKNNATGGLHAWCEATIKCYLINKEVEPKKKKAREMRAAKEKGERELAETEANLAQINQVLSELNADKQKQQSELDELERKSREMTRKLNAASTLITGLGSEQIRWSADKSQFEIDKVKLIGDCLTGSAFLSYCGPFNSELRQKMIFDTWKQDLIDKELPNKEDI